MNKRTLTRLLAIVMALGLIATACGGSDADDAATADTATSSEAADTGDGAEPEEAEADPEPEQDAEPDEPEPEESEPEEADDDAALGNVEVDEEAANCATEVELDRGTYAPSGDIVDAIGFTVGTPNPHDNQTPASFRYYGLMYEGLARQDVDGSVVPWLAKCWESNDDGTQITFYLHEGVTFHDGEVFDAAAVKANIEHVKTAGPPQVIPPVAGQMGIVDSVEVVDDLTVQFNLTAPGEALLLSGLIRQSGLMVSPAALGSADQNPIGTGPYVLESTNSDVSELHLVAFENYWQPGLVGVETIDMVHVPDAQARLDGFNAGQFDIANVNAPQVPGITRGDVASAATVRIGFVFADWTGEQIPQLANRDVRCAMAQALNREGAMRAALTPGWENSQFATGPDDYAWIDDLEVPEFDIEAAKAAFEATGEAPFEFLNGHLGTGGTFPDTSAAWATGLAELGITMNNEVLDPPSAAEMFVRLAKAQHPVQVIPFNEPNALMSLIARTGEAGFNPSGVSPDGVVELVEAAKTKSFEDGEADVAAAWKIMLEECVFVINHVLPTFLIYGDDVKGLHHTQGIPVQYWPQGVTAD